MVNTETEQRTAGFRRWVWVAVLPGLFALLGVVAAVPVFAIAWSALAAGVVFLAWRGRTTPWWGVVGWMLCLVGVANVIGAAMWDGTPAPGIVLALVGAALGAASLVVNAVRRPAA